MRAHHAFDHDQNRILLRSKHGNQELSQVKILQIDEDIPQELREHSDYVEKIATQLKGKREREELHSRFQSNKRWCHYQSLIYKTLGDFTKPYWSKSDSITFNFLSSSLIHSVTQWQRAITYIRHREVNDQTMGQIRTQIAQSDLDATRLSTAIVVPLFGEEFLATYN